MRAARLLPALVLVLPLLAGCTGPSLPEARVDPAAELAARPTLEEAVARYEGMERELRERLDAELGPFAWYPARDGTDGTCGSAFPGELRGRIRYLAPWTFDAPLDDAAWDRAREIVAAVIAEHGFAVGGAQVAQGRLRTLNAVDTALGAQFTFLTDAATVLQTTTGCHRPAGRGG